MLLPHQTNRRYHRPPRGGRRRFGSCRKPVTCRASRKCVRLDEDAYGNILHRVAFTVASVSTDILNALDGDGTGSVHADLNTEFSNAGQPLTAPSVAVTEIGKSWEITDGGKTYLLENVNGDLVVRRKVKPATSILYSGEQTDASGLQYLRARYYDPANGRFNRLDPFAGNNSDPQSLHKYLYAHANPVMNTDPTGRFVFGIVGGVIGAVGQLNARAAETGVKARVKTEVGILLGAGTAGSLAGAGLYRQFGLSPATGATYGFKLGFGIVASYRQGRSRLTAALAEGFNNAIVRSVRHLTPTVLDQLRNATNVLVGGRPVPTNWSNVASGFFDASFRGFADGIFAGATQFKSGDAFFDIIDAGLTSTLSGVINGEITNFESAAKHFAEGASYLAFTKAISGAIGAAGGGPVEDHVANALASYLFSLAVAIAEEFDR